MTVTHRVLVVDDYEPWRSHVRCVLQATVEWQIVGEAADGPEAIQKAAELKPDLILLDVGLPTLSGIKVAERILAVNPSQRILFISEHRSLAEGALATGARGYIIKSDAAFELLPAMAAIVKGRRYVGASAAMPSRQSHPDHVHRHDVGFYPNEASLLDAWTEAAKTALANGHTVILLAVDSRRRAVHEILRTAGIDVDGAIEQKRYVAVDPSEMLSQFMVDNWPDEVLFQKAVSPIVVEALSAATSTLPRVMVCGECAPTLLREGKGEAALRVEQLWDKIMQAHQVDTLCAYLRDSPPSPELDKVFRRISAVHTEVVGLEPVQLRTVLAD
jgi:DNA-binding NarL/FixJ family response regulator